MRNATGMKSQNVFTLNTVSGKEKKAVICGMSMSLKRTTTVFLLLRHGKLDKRRGRVEKDIWRLRILYRDEMPQAENLQAVFAV